MGILDILQSPQGLLGLSVLGQADRPAQGLLQGLARNQQFQQQGLQQELVKAKLLQAQQESESERQAQERDRQLQAGRAGLSALDQDAIIDMIRRGDLQGAQSIISSVNAFKESAPLVQNIVGQGKPLGKDAAHWTNAEGKKPSPTMDVYDAAASGYTPKTTEELKSIQAGKSATPMISNIVNFGFGVHGEDSLFPPENTPVADRLLGSGMDYLKGITKSDARISLYNDSKRAFRAGIARLIGHTGVLTAKDVGDATALLPVPGLTTEPQAKRQFQQVAELLMGKGVPRNMLEELGMPEWAFSRSTQTPDSDLSDEDKALLEKYGGK